MTHSSFALDLDALPDAELVAYWRAQELDSQERDHACEALVRRYRPLVRACVRPFMNSPEPTDDLMQVGYVGLMKAIKNFDPSFGNELRAFAAPCVSGEIKRHFRDKRWQVRVTRPVQELLLEIRGVTEDLTHELGRTPLEAELAHRLGVTPDDVREARQAAGGMSALSLDAPIGDDGEAADLGDLLGGLDSAFEQVTDMEAVSQHWADLPRREQKILIMRFYGNFTQEQIAVQLGISQMHVSRLQAKALARLRDLLAAPAETSARAAV